MAASSSSSSTGYEVPVSFDALLASLPSQEKVNFLAACRLIYDNATLVLREVCKRESGGNVKLPLPTENKLGVEVRLKDNEFTALASHLLLEKRDKDEPGSFFKKVQKVPCKFDDRYFGKIAKKNCLELKPQPADENSFCLAVGGQVQIPKITWGKLEKIKGSHFCIWIPSWVRRVDSPVDVYLPTETWWSVDNLRILRNTHIGHASTANLTDDALKKMFTCVNEAYEKLAVCELSIAGKVYKELEDIKTSCKDWSKERVKNALVKYKQRVEEYWQKLTTLNDQVSVMENELYVLKTSTQEGFGALERDTQETVKSAVADMKDYVDELQSQNETSTQKKLDALERDTQETVKSAAADAKDYVDGKVDDLQSQTEDTVSALKTSTQETVKSAAAVVKDYVDGKVDDLQSQTEDTVSALKTSTQETVKSATAVVKDYVDGKVDDLKSQAGSGPPQITNILGGQGNSFNIQLLQQNFYTGGYAGSSPQPGAAAQQYSCTPPQRPQLQSSRFASGPPTQDEITKLSENIIKCPSYQMDRSKIGKTLGMDVNVVASEPYAHVSNLLTQWVEKSSNNSRDQLYKLLGEAKLSTAAENVLYRQ